MKYLTPQADIQHDELMLNQMNFSLPEAIDAAVKTAIADWNAANKTARIWQRDADVWTGGEEAKWLGWLDIVSEEKQNIDSYREFTLDIDQAGFSDVLLMGMGGSSLCPEVLALTFGRERFHILDSTVPEQVLAVENRLDLENTLFIVASKSGSTLEPNCFKQYFFGRLAEKVGRERAGRQFVAITDPGSKMEAIAREDGFRHIFFGKPDVGGRFSALSAFGMTAAAAMGLDPEMLLNPASDMAEACRADDANTNPGALLGLTLGVSHALGRDKLTIFTSPEISDLGAWLEQLVAESTGKNGVAIIPVDREPQQPVETYGNDRIFVSLAAGAASHDAIAGLADAGHPVIEITLNSVDEIGQEFFRWEFATAVAGAVMGIDPFNQPDVESAKIEARKITEAYELTGSLPAEAPFMEEDGIELYTSPEYAAKLTNAAVGAGLKDVIGSHLALIGPSDYFALLAYLNMTAENERILAGIRETVLKRSGAATCLGFGPRFLHSTGQAYKGGANNGVFLQITADDVEDIQVPDQKFTFGVVKTAQARGDFQVLVDRGRRALRVHFRTGAGNPMERLSDLI